MNYNFIQRIFAYSARIQKIVKWGLLMTIDISNFNCLFILGPTASGKSALALDLAKKYNGVIINADSMQVYAGVDILTAVPSMAERGDIDHRLYSFIDPIDSFDVSTWRDMAVGEIEDVLADGKLPILCGGTGLYASAMTKGLAPVPNVDTGVRQEVRFLQEILPLKELYDILKDEDPIMASRLTIADPQRIVRALEVIRSTGKSLAHFQDMPNTQIPEHIKLGLIALTPDRQTVYDNINNRFDGMVENGGLAQAQELIHNGIDDTYQIGRAIGVRELMEYENGVVSLDQAVTNAKTATRRYAKRQLTYINTQLDADIVLVKAEDLGF